MKFKYVKIICCWLLFISAGISSYSQIQSVHSFKIDSVKHTKQISFSEFQGRKILIVSTAMLDRDYILWRDLEQLQNKFLNKLVIVIIPTVNINNENASGFFKDHPLFVIASKETAGTDKVNKLFELLHDNSSNKSNNSSLRGAFQKYLINEKGKPVAVFGPAVRAMSKTVMDAVEISY